MRSVRSLKNQYRGINAHLHSYYQADGKSGWVQFHQAYINDIVRLMQTQLLPMGYIADMEHSLQIRRDSIPIRKPKSDVTIFDPQPFQREPQQQPLFTGVLPLVLELPDVLDDLAAEDFYPAVAIYEIATATEGKPVTWIEVLSPSNKPGGQDAETYASKRLDLLRTGINFVEVDYLHESLPTFDKLADFYMMPLKYPDFTATAYRIIMITPRPSLSSGKAYLYPFDVETPIPLVHIPLSGDDELWFDFNTAYDKTLTEMGYALRYVNYAELPLNFERYSPSNQARIANRMVAVLQAVHDELDLEAVTLPIPSLSLDNALKQIAQLRSV